MKTTNRKLRSPRSRFGHAPAPSHEGRPGVKGVRAASSRPTLGRACRLVSGGRYNWVVRPTERGRLKTRSVPKSTPKYQRNSVYKSGVASGRSGRLSGGAVAFVASLGASAGGAAKRSPAACHPKVAARAAFPLIPVRRRARRLTLGRRARPRQIPGRSALASRATRTRRLRRSSRFSLRPRLHCRGALWPKHGSP